MSAYARYRATPAPTNFSYSSDEGDDEDIGYSYGGLSDTKLSDLLSGFGSLRVGQEKRRYGYFQCPKCHKKWESARTWCTYEGIKNRKQMFKATSKQACKQCNVMTLPEYTRALERPAPGEERHVDERKAHRADLCSRCLGGLPCKGV